jgi:lysozyme family protein
MANFENIFLWVMKQEDSTLSGKIVNLMDGQGRTRYGVAEFSHSSLPADFYTCDSTTALLEAKVIYKGEYWDRFMGDQILDDGVASCLLSFSINDGEGREVMMLQQVLGFNSRDGIMGPITLAATNKMEPVSLAAQLRTAQANFYKMLVAKQPTDARFLDGWLKRAARIFPSLA